MSKKSKKKHKKKRRRSAKNAVKMPVRTKKSKSVLLKVAVFLIIPCVIYFLFFTRERKNSPIQSQQNSSQQTLNNSAADQFRAEGELIFFRNPGSAEIKKIAIEIADDSIKRTQGLKYRTLLPDTAGMLFIFENSEQRSFWMQNTHISLDIIYVNEKKEIVTIQRHTKPLSEDSILSYDNAMYVVEVNAGFCDKYKIVEGDSISFLLNKE